MYEIHPFATAFPSMQPEEFAALKESISISGVRYPVLLWEGKVIDGRHRYLACQEIGIPCPTTEFTGDEDAALKIVSDLNSHRRNLTASQRAAAAAKLAAVYTQRRQEKSGAVYEYTENTETGRTREIAAKATGVSPAYVARMIAVDRAVPELTEKVSAGEITLPEAEKIVEATRPPEPEVDDPFDRVMSEGRAIGSLIRDLQACEVEFLRIADLECGNRYRPNSIRAAFESILTMARAGRPYCKRPEGLDKTQGTKIKTPWLTRAEYDGLPIELQKQVKPRKGDE